jgi:hypothetical protein
MEVLLLALPVLTSAVMFAFKKIATLAMFANGAEARPWLRALLIVTSLFGVGSTALLNGTPVNADSVSYLLQLLVGTGINAFMAHAFYAWLKPAISPVFKQTSPVAIGRPFCGICHAWNKAAHERVASHTDSGRGPAMSFEDDRTGHPRHRRTVITTYKGWIVGTVAALVILYGIVEVYRHDNNYTPPTTPGPTTPSVR